MYSYTATIPSQREYAGMNIDGSWPARVGEIISNWIEDKRGCPSLAHQKLPAPQSAIAIGGTEVQPYLPPFRYDGLLTRETQSTLGGYGADIVPIFIVLGPPAYAMASADIQSIRRPHASRHCRYFGRYPISSARPSAFRQVA